jgi:hypothetical protein
VKVGIRNRFRLNLDLIYKLLDCIPAEGATPAAIRSQFPELGGEKIRGVREWADDLGLTYPDGLRDFLTPLGKAIRLTKGSMVENKMREILYYKLSTSKDLDVFRTIVNVILFDVSRRVDPTVDIDEIKRRVLAAGIASEASSKYVQGEVSTVLNALTSMDGLGATRIVLSVGQNRYKVNPYRPDWRATAYILYDSWPATNPSRMRVEEVATGYSRLGRIFFLSQSEVIILLSKLEQERAIALEVVADLNQIGLNPAMKAEDFLEMLIHDLAT